MRRETTVLAPDVVPGDIITSAGISGVVGLVTRVHVAEEYVGVWLDGASLPHSLGLVEAVDVEREFRAEAA